MNTLVVRHVGNDGTAQFQVVRLADSKSADTVAVASPVGFPVEGRPNSDLRRELLWYLETFLAYPFPPETHHAERVLDALKAWGQQAFTALFGSERARDWFHDATRDGYEHLGLHVSSDDPRVLAWPWEALHDPEAGFLGQHSQVERRLNEIRDPMPLPESLPEDRVNILLVTARPLDQDVRYRSISRPLVELVHEHELPARVHVLRPPTFDRLREHLRERPGFYHILHFDGHGGYGAASDHSDVRHVLQAEGVLAFEDADGKPDPISAEQLSVLLREHRIPAVVLNACRSAMVDERAGDRFASVAAGLLQAGIRDVVAMAYSLYVTGAQRFLPAFYERLFASGSVAEATRAGRQEMLAHPERVCARGRFPLRDWLVPVLYQQDPFDFSFATQAAAEEEEEAAALPEEALEKLPYGFIGRDGLLLELERAMRRGPAGILVHGLGGVGKTTLAQGFVRWLNDTEGLGLGCYWFRFDEIRSAEYVFNRMGEPLFGQQFAAARSLDQKVQALAQHLAEHPFLIVWDNFEVVAGIEGSVVTAQLSEPDRAAMRSFLQQLRGGRTKVLITSRSEEAWLGIERGKVPIGGLRHEEQWKFCDAVLRDLNVKIDRDDPNLVRLMRLINGHPLAMRVILPCLEAMTAVQVLDALQSNLDALGMADDDQRILYATLRFATEALPEPLRPLLIPLALHERFIDGDLLEHMAQQVDEALNRPQVDGFLRALAKAGLLHERGQPVFEMHPALPAFLRATAPADADDQHREPWIRAFVGVMGGLADALAPKPLHEQRGTFHCHGANFRRALKKAERLHMELAYRALLQSLASYALNSRSFTEAAALFQRLVEARRKAGNEEQAAGTYHQLGMVAQAQRDFDAAQQWYCKALPIFERLGIEQHAASTQGQLGLLARDQERYEQSGQWLVKSIAGFTRTNDDAGIYQGRRNFRITYDAAPPDVQAKLRAMWEAAGLGAFPKKGDGE